MRIFKEILPDVVVSLGLSHVMDKKLLFERILQDAQPEFLTPTVAGGLCQDHMQ